LQFWVFEAAARERLAASLGHMTPSMCVDACDEFFSRAEQNMTKSKIILQLLFPVTLFIVAHHYQPLATDLFGILFALIFVCLGLQIYFMPIRKKQENIAKFKTRHGIPLDEPHEADKILI
jgi:hypothetical protein